VADPLSIAMVATTAMGVAANIEGANTAIEGNAAAAAAEKKRAQRIAAAKEFEAQQLEQDAGQAIAASQRQRDEEHRTARLVASRALAVAAASGAGASDTTVVNLIARTKGEGAYRGAVALYEGEERSRRLLAAAGAKRYEGAVAIEGGYDAERAYAYKSQAAATTATGNIMGSLGGLFGKYGGGGFGGGGGSGDAALLDTGSMATSSMAVV
jgi:hypothetical protein